MPINPVAKQILSSSLRFKSSKHTFKYLGIWITHHFKHHDKADFLPLIDSLKNDWVLMNAYSYLFDKILLFTFR